MAPAGVPAGGETAWTELLRGREVRKDGPTSRSTFLHLLRGSVVVGMPGFEPGASTSRTWRAAKLRYIPSCPGLPIAPGTAVYRGARTGDNPERCRRSA